MREMKEKNIEEARQFTGWVEDCPFETERFFPMLKDTLELAEGEIAKHKMFYEFVDDVAKIAKGNELSAIQCITKALMQPKNRVTYFTIEAGFGALIERIAKLPNDYPRINEIHTEAKKMANALGRKHLEVDKFRKLYEELRKKSQRG